MQKVLRAAVCAAFVFGQANAIADVWVVTAQTSSVKETSQKELQALYMGRKRDLNTSDAFEPLDLPRDHPARDAFYSALTGMTAAQVNAYWARLLFSGQTSPPPTLTSEQSMLDRIRKVGNAVGYLGSEPTDSRLRVLLVLKTPSVN